MKQLAERISVDIEEKEVGCRVAGGGRHGPGILQKFIGYKRHVRMGISRDERSNSRCSGELIYNLDGPGFYFVQNAALSNTASGDIYFIVDDDDEVDRVRRDAIEETFHTLFPAEAAEAAAKKAEQRRCELEKKETETADLEDAKNALETGDVVEFNDEESGVTSIEVASPITERGVKFGEQARLIEHYATSATNKNRRSYGRGYAEFAIDTNDGMIGIRIKPGSKDEGGCEERCYLLRSGEFRECRIDELLSEVDVARGDVDSNLPDLSGTKKQVAWARDIRNRFAEKNPKSPLLKKATTAKYWITHRHDLEKA